MKRIELKVTYKCTSRCRHCMYCSTDRQETFLTASDAERIIRQIHPTECVLFTGGEASLAPELVVHGMGFAKSLDIDSWLVSNGLTRVLISVDALHQEFVPLDYTLGAIRSLREAAAKPIKAAVTFVDRQKGLAIDRRTARLLAAVNKEPGVIPDIRTNVDFLGRAISTLKSYAPQITLDELLNHCCVEQDRLDDLDSPYYTVGAEGKVFICVGFTYPGDLRSVEFKDIICKENILGNRLVAHFYTEGVRGLFDYAIVQGYQPLERYAGTCHLCWHVRDFLRPAFPDVLIPVHAYGNEMRQ